jgi:hypothetical protein
MWKAKIMAKFEVSPTVARSRNYASYRRFARNRNAIPVSRTVRLTFRMVWTPDHDFAPHLYSGRQLLDILSGFRTGDLNLFNA